MYYRKYFSGDIDDTTITTSVKFGNDISNTTVYVNQSIIIGNAIADTLKDIGVDAQYNEETFILHFNKKYDHGVYIFFTAQNSYTMALYSNEIGLTNKSNSSASYPLFSIPYGSQSGSYKFYITLKGEPKTMMLSEIGYYANPSKGSYFFIWGYCNDIRYNKKLFLWNASAALGSARSGKYYVRNIDSTLVEGYTGTTAQVNFRIIRLNSNDANTLPLINLFSYDGFFILENCFFGTSQISSTDTFYLIDEEEYYILDDYTIIKCKTEMPQVI